MGMATALVGFNSSRKHIEAEYGGPRVAFASLVVGSTYGVATKANITAIKSKQAD